MTKTRRVFTSLAVGVAMTGSFFAGFATAGQPHMRNALNDLQHARNQLQVATADKAGHRANAIGLVDQAITQVNEGIAAGAR